MAAAKIKSKLPEIKNDEYEALYKENIRIFRDNKEFIIPGAIFGNMTRQKVVIEDEGIFHIGKNYRKPIAFEKVCELIRETTKKQYEDNKVYWQLGEKEKLENYFETLLGE